MATGKALDGKPYAGNPHVWFDEGEVAPTTTPRRGSLLYKKMTSAFCVFALMPLVLAASQLPAETVTTVCPKATDEAWFGAPIPASGYDSSIPDCGMTAARIFDAPIEGLKRIGTLVVPKSADLPETSNASIGFECLDRGLFDPDRCYDTLAAAGIKWARVQTMWCRCEKQKGVYDFTVLDGVVDNLTRRGVRPWFCVTFGNTLYMTNCFTGAAVGCVPTLYGDECRAAWCAYVRELAKRYKGKVSHWEIWNEPTNAGFWQPSKPNAAEYLELVKLTGGIVREVIPDAKIGGTTAGAALKKFEADFFELGGAAAIDFWCNHAYACVPERLRYNHPIASGETSDYIVALKNMRKFIDGHGGRHVEIWQGESGFPSWFPAGHWLFKPDGVCKEGWQSQANQAKWLLRRFVTDRRAGIVRSSFFQMADISRQYSVATVTRPHPAEYGIVNGWTYEPKMSCRAFGNYNALLATAIYDDSVNVSLTPVSDGGAPTVAAAFRTANGSPLFLYYTAFDFSGNYTGTCYTARCDAKLAVPAALAPKDPVLVDMLRGGVYSVSTCAAVADGFATFSGLPLVDYPLVLMDRANWRRLSSSSSDNARMAVVEPTATDEALINPDMGFVYYKYSNRLWAYGINTPENDTLDWFPGCSTVYMRVLWNDIEPEEGEYRWDLFDSAAQNWIAKGKKIALRVMTCSQTENATPQFVRDAGAKGHLFEYQYDDIKIPSRWEPIYDDPVFLEKLGHFLAALARRYDGDPNVAFIDIGTLGIYGEGNPRPNYPLPPDAEPGDEKRRTDVDPPAWKIRLGKLHIDLWRRHFKKTYLVGLDGFDGGWNPLPDGEVMQYMRANGIGFRDDSIFCFKGGGVDVSFKGVSKHYEYWCHDNWARLFAPLTPVVVETGHAPHLVGTPRWETGLYARCVEAYQASYLSIHDFPDVHLNMFRKEIDQINKIIGYRFELREVMYPKEVKIGEKVEIGSTWVNVGVAPKTKSAALAWSLLNPDGTVAWCVTDNAFDFRSLEPKLGGVEKPHKVTTPCRFGCSKRIPEPDNCVVWARAAGRKFPDTFVPLKPGTYTLAVSVGSWQGTPEIALPLGGQIGTTRRYEIGRIHVVCADKDADAPLFLHQFDAGKDAPKLFYYAYRPIESVSQAEVAVVMIHGWGGQMRPVLPDFTKALAARAGSDEFTPYVIAPLFPRRATMTSNNELKEGCAVWCDSWNDGKIYPGRSGSATDDWRGGGDANGTSFSSFDYIDAIFAKFADRAKYPNLRKVILAGFSAGGQLTGRYVATGKGVVRDGVKVVYVVMSPSSEFLFEPERPWHFGLKGRPRYSASITEEEIMKNLCSRRVWRGCGSLDILETPKKELRDRFTHVAAQGTNRYERFKYFERYLDKYPEWKKCVSFHVIEGAAHKTLPCFLDPALLDFVFE